MKKFLGVLAILMVLFCMSEVKAFSVDSNTVYIEENSNKTIHLYADLKESTKKIMFNLTYSSLAAGTNFYPAEGIKDDYNKQSTHTVTFTEAKKGKIDLGTIIIKTGTKNGSVTIKEVTDTSKNNNVLGLKTVKVNVSLGEPEGPTPEPEPVEEPVAVISEPEPVEEPDTLLERIDSNIVNITLKKDVYEYTVTVPADIKTLDLKPITTSSNVNTIISSQVISELENGIITITVGNGTKTEHYKIHVKLTKEIKEIPIDKDTEFEPYHFKWKYIVVILLSIGAIAAVYFVKLPSKKD